VGAMNKRARLAVAGGFLALFALATLAVAGWNGYQDRRIAELLRRDGVEVDADVVGYKVRYKHNAAIGDEVKVAFNTVDGRRVETWLVVNTNAEPPSPTRIRYLRTDPTVARLATDIEPRAGALAFFLILYAILGLIGGALWWFFKEMDRQLGLRS
jgi:hypothetical protein